MKEIEKLYEVLGELLYTVAIADGIIQDEEISSLNKLLENHAWASEIKWSFNYEASKKTPVDAAYNKVINFCQGYGPSAVYPEFIKSMRAIANAARGIDENEYKVIDSFSNDLIERFQKDLDKLSKS